MLLVGTTTSVRLAGTSVSAATEWIELSCGRWTVKFTSLTRGRGCLQQVVDIFRRHVDSDPQVSNDKVEFEYRSRKEYSESRGSLANTNESHFIAPNGCGYESRLDASLSEVRKLLSAGQRLALPLLASMMMLAPGTTQKYLKQRQKISPFCLHGFLQF